MPAKRLTATYCDSASAVRGRQTSYPDQDVRGLELRISGATEARRYRPKRATSLDNERRVYAVHIAPPLSRLPLESVNRRVVKGALTRMLDSGVTSQAVRAQAVIRQIFTFAVFEERLDINRIRDLPPVAPSKARARTFRDEELRAIWNGAKAPELLRLPDASPRSCRIVTGCRLVSR